MKNSDTTIICICSPERLSQYKVLYSSILKFCGSVDTILYYGGETNPTIFGQVVNIKNWIDKSIYKNDLYTYCSIRAKCLLDAFSKGYEKVILVGSDTEFFDYPKLCFDSLDKHDCFVTMYTFEPYIGDETLYPNDLQTIDVGQINTDLIGYKNTPEVIQFLKWLDNKLINKCVASGRDFVDQVWTSLVFSFLNKVEIIRELGYNVANYNLHNRGMKLENGKWIMKDGSSLILFHYAGFEKGKEENISKHQNRYKATGDVLEFLREYGKKL